MYYIKNHHIYQIHNIRHLIKVMRSKNVLVREAAKKVLFLVAGPLRKKRTFFNVRKKFLWPLSRVGGGGGGGAKGLSGRATKNFFCGFPKQEVR